MNPGQINEECELFILWLAEHYNLVLDFENANEGTPTSLSELTEEYFGKPVKPVKPNQE